MEKLKNGQRFNKLVVVSETNERLNRSIVYKCKCDCGKTVYTTRTRLEKGLTKSCGCLQRQRASEANKTHGLSSSKIYSVYRDMKRRCNSKNHHAYKYYGGRGITVCKSWNNDFSAFYKWALINGYEEGLTIDRIDNDEGYSPENCRWVTMTIQCNNRRKPKNIELSKNPNAKPVNMYSLDDNLVKTYGSIKEACIDNNIKGTGNCISACCRGKQKTAYNYKWQYADIFNLGGGAV